MIWNRPSDSPIDDLSQQNTDDDRELIQADKPTSDRRRADLRNIKRRDIRGETNCSAAYDSPENERRKTVGPAGEYRRNRKQNGGDEKDAPAPEAISKEACCKRADQAPDERTAIRPADKLLGGQTKICLIELSRAADDNPVVPEKEAAHRGDDRDTPDVPAPLRLHETSFRVTGDGCPVHATRHSWRGSQEGLRHQCDCDRAPATVAAEQDRAPCLPDQRVPALAGSWP